MGVSKMRFWHKYGYATKVFAAVLCISCIGANPIFSQTPPKEKLWFQRAMVGMEVGPTGAQFGYSDPRDTRYCEKWDGAEIVRRCVAAEAEYLVLWLRDGDFAYYNSTRLPKAPGLRERDPLREAIDEAAKHDLPIISYCVVQQGGLFLQENPQWKMRDVSGKEIERFCYNSGYLQEMKEIIAEQLAYGIDGFHIDMLDQGFGKPYGCWCDTCRQLFREKYHHDMPSNVKWDQLWDEMLEFRYATSERFEKELTAYIRSRHPNVTVDYNYHGSPPFSFEVGQRPVQHAGNGDFVTGETGVWGFSALGVGLNAEFYRASTPRVPFQVAIQRGVRMYHDQTTRPLHDMRWETLTLLAHGAFVTMIDKTAFDGSLDPLAYERIGKVLGEAKSKREHFGQRQVFDIGLYFSSRTRDWMGREDPAKYFHSFQGAHQACVMEHLQYGVILDENATLDRLRKFPVVCLPNAAILSKEEVDLFRSYVREGGRLLITGQSGQFDQWGQPLSKSVLEGLIGATLTERLESEDNWVSVDEGTLSCPESQLVADDLRVNWPFLVKGPATIYQPTTAKPLGKLYKPHRTKRQLQGKMHTEWPMSADSPVGAAAFINNYGKGRVVTCAASPDYAAASEHALVEHRTLFRNLFRTFQTQRSVVVEGPANVEAVVTDDPQARTLRLHLLAYNSTPRTTPGKNRPYVLPGMIVDKPIYRVRLVVDGLRSAAAINPTTELKVNENTVKATVEDIHEVILLRY